MYKFIDKSEYELVSLEQVSPTQINWTHIDENGTRHSGFFIKNTVSNHARITIDSETGDEISEQFYPFSEALEMGIVPAFDEAAYNEKLNKEQAKLAKQKGIAALELLTIEVDGYVFQCDSKSKSRIADAILAAQTDEKTEIQWRLADNSIELVSVETLKKVHSHAVQQLSDVVLSE